MLLFFPVFPFLPLIISCPYFIVPFIVSQIFFSFISINVADSCFIQVSRLILNLLEANCPLDESIYVLDIRGRIGTQDDERHRRIEWHTRRRGLQDNSEMTKLLPCKNTTHGDDYSNMDRYYRLQKTTTAAVYLFDKCSHIDQQRWYCCSSAHDDLTTAYKESFHVIDLGSQLKPVIEHR